LIDGVRFFNPASAGPRRFYLDWRSKPALKKRMNQLSRK